VQAGSPYGSYSVGGMVNGSYYVKVSSGYVYVDQLYDGVLVPDRLRTSRWGHRLRLQ
jgi:hypothetical protein